tara:strand:- start:513 stop:716 length:204 start_codon:yes stop_codon:yes gene_type:complete
MMNDINTVLWAGIIASLGFIKYASDIFWNDRKRVLAVVRKNGYALQYASEELKQDREVVLAAVRRLG